MRRWQGHGALAIIRRPCRPWRTSWGFPFHLRINTTRLITTAEKDPKTEKEKKRSPPDDVDYQQYAVFRKTPVPETDSIHEWAALLDGALPPHLRDPKVTPPLLTLAATDLAEVLLAARAGEIHHDLLFYLGFRQGRWSAVVWLVKKLVDRFPIAREPDTATLKYLSMWNQVAPFHFIATHSTASKIRRDAGPLELEVDAGRIAGEGSEDPLQPHLADMHSGSMRSLDELTDSPDAGSTDQHSLAHDALGHIWQTLGTMTVACAGGSIRPEVLEIIAYLHHREIMPTSIYQYQPRRDKSAIQQPPLIPLLSSRILACLSDAAWRAHEKLLVEEARVRLGDGDIKGPAVLAAPYRARVDGLFPEVWLELILWSCLHGGWIEQGSSLMASIVRKDWKPLSWREYERALSPNGQLDSNDWDAWDYLFKTRAKKSMDPPSHPIPEVQRTVSAEVVNAYIDALANLGRNGLQSRSTGRSPLQKLHDLRRFLEWQNLGLTTGSWDALAARVMENQAISPEKLPIQSGRVVQLSSHLGQGLESKNTQDLPAYVLDGGLAMQGMLNRSLYGRLKAGDLEPALRVFQGMLLRTDRDKQASMASFMEGSKPLLRALHGDGMSTSNVPGIEYPAFNLQIPTTTLALFLDLVTQSKEYDFGRWLLYSNDADGPVIREDQYSDRFLTPALVRFAAATRDSGLFSKLRALPNFSVYPVLDAQIYAMRWDAVGGIVQNITKPVRPGRPPPKRRTWNMNNLAFLARVMLSQVSGAASGHAESRENLQSAKEIFSIMVQQVMPARKYAAIGVQTLLNAIASVDETWAKFCHDLRRRAGHHDFELSTLQFNHLLQGVVGAYGSVAGRRLLDRFWPQSVRRGSGRESSMREGHVIETPRIVVPLPGVSPDHKAVMYGALTPNVKTITIILQKALEELRDRGADNAAASQTTTSPGSGDADGVRHDDGSEPVEMMSQRDMVAWAATQMANISRVTSRSYIIFTLEAVLDRFGLEDLREAVPEIVRGVEMNLGDVFADDVDHDDEDEDEGGDDEGIVAMEENEEESTAFKAGEEQSS